jgi:hypothetical protein
MQGRAFSLELSWPRYRCWSSHKRDPAFAHKHPPASPLPRAYAPTDWLKETPYCASAAAPLP